MGFQNDILAPVNESEAFYKMMRLRDYGACKKPMASFLRLM